MMTSTLAQLMTSRRVVVCAGSGGVGKTTVAAALSLAGAERGLRVLCMTIDPAKRLANALGFERMSTDARRVDQHLLEAVGVSAGSLTVLMLDSKKTFDDLVRRHAPPEVRDRIFENRLYQQLSTSLAGTQSYMAMEKVLEVLADQTFDWIVVDTPPTEHALDFLRAPERMIDAIDSETTQWLARIFGRSGKLGAGLVASGARLALRGLSRITGAGLFEQIAELLGLLRELFGGFRERATRVSEAFRGPEFGYVIVATPTSASVRDVRFLEAQLARHGIGCDALVVNRVHRSSDASVLAREVAEALGRHRLKLRPDAPARVLTALSDEQRLARVDHDELQSMQRALRNSGSLFIEIPALASDVHDLSGLMAIAEALCPPHDSPAEGEAPTYRAGAAGDTEP